VVGGDGEAVLADRARVVSRGGLDLTQQCMAGAERAVEAARANGVTLAVLKEGSPSCGVHRNQDGTVYGRFVAGHRVTTACLRRAGIRVLSEVEEEAFWGAVQAACGEFDPPGDASDAGLR
jgi:uncharacterized protein YbbK (DUF523 family)